MQISSWAFVSLHSRVHENYTFSEIKFHSRRQYEFLLHFNGKTEGWKKSFEASHYYCNRPSTQNEILKKKRKSWYWFSRNFFSTNSRSAEGDTQFFLFTLLIIYSSSTINSRLAKNYIIMRKKSPPETNRTPFIRRWPLLMETKFAVSVSFCFN